MAIKKNTPAHEQKVEKTLNTKAEAVAYGKKQVKFYKESGFSARYDTKLVPYSNQWQVTLYIYID